LGLGVLPDHFAVRAFRDDNPLDSEIQARGIPSDCTGRSVAYDKATADLTESIRLDPDDASTHVDRGEFWLDKNDYDKAITDFDETIRLDPTDAVSYSERGDAWQAKGELDKAIADFNEAVRVGPEAPYSYTARAWIWATCPDDKYRDGKKAVESATKACELTKWNEADYLVTLAAAYAEVGDFESAVKWQTKANELRDDDDDKTVGESCLKLYQEKKPFRDDGSS
jgi:tetratricopeptide (TPR) repeat protein